MKLLTRLVTTILCCTPAFTFANACPDPATISVVNKKVVVPEGYIYEPIAVIEKDMNPSLYRSELITYIINDTTVRIDSVQCVYELGADAEFGSFYLVKHFLNIVTDDDSLLKTGWKPQNRRKWFLCYNTSGNTCTY